LISKQLVGGASLTIAITIKIHDGIVLATDSRSSLVDQNSSGKPIVVHAFDHANKTVNLHRDLPLGVITSGQGSIGNRSIETLAKEFRDLISGARPEWQIDPNNYTVQQVVEFFHQYVYHEAYAVEFKDWTSKPGLSFQVAGYSAHDRFPEVWELCYNDSNSPDPKLTLPVDDTGVTWLGDGEALHRLVLGVGKNLPLVLVRQGVEMEQIRAIMDDIKTSMNAPMYHPAMPIRDAIDLAEFLVYTTGRFTQHIPGGATVGGPTEIAAITRHEGFKWVKRKHYYDSTLNP
jgi:hypothetical protein